jgi:hypothetical protein
MTWKFWRKRPEVVEMAVRANPVTLNPSDAQHKEFAEWRAAHIDRWLEHNAEDAGTLPEKVAQLIAERDMYRALLRMNEGG